MPVTGTNADLASKMAQEITSKLVAATGQSMMAPAFLKALCDAISDSVIKHLVQNVTLVVESGIAVSTTGGPSAQTGSTTAPGTGKIT